MTTSPVSLPLAGRTARPLYMGPRIKRLRRELGLTQQAMASDLEISPSYVALMERNQRPVTADLLLRLARTYQLDMSELAADDGADYNRRLTEVLRDPIFSGIDMPALEVADLATSFPGMSEALLRLYGAYTREQAALADRQADLGAGLPDPVAEARRFLAAHRNHFPALEASAETLAAAIAREGDGAAWLARHHGIRTRFLPPYVMMGSMRRFDRHNRQLLLDEGLYPATRAFQIALQIVWHECRAQITEIARAMGDEHAEGPARTEVHLVKRALASYTAGAILMPYDRFARVVEERAYDIEAVARVFGTSFEQTAHRFTTLGRSNGAGGSGHVPFFFIRVDGAGNVSKRLDGAGFPFAAHGGGCPLWSVHQVFATPLQVVTQWLELPDGQRFFSIARTVEAGGGGYNRPRAIRAVALACAAEHAPRLAYAQGLNPRSVPATPIGITCRLCHRPDCIARALPPIGRDLMPDDTSRSATPLGLDEG